MGQTVAAALATSGCDLALTYNRSRDSAEESARRARSHGVRAVEVKADLSKPKGAAEAVDAVHDRLGGPHILVCMASVYARVPFDSLDERAWRTNLDVDLSSAFHLARRAAPLMRSAGGGRIVLFSHWLPRSGRPRYRGYLPYYGSQAGIVGLNQSLALEPGPEV